MQQTRSDIFTVSKLNRFAKHILESEIGSIWLSAEISNFVAASSGHWYFTLKDSRAQVKAAMFKGSNRKTRFRPKEGDKVLVRGDISVYEARGDYQLIATHLEPDGLGDLKQQFEALKAKLAAQGLFSQERKTLIPEKPARVGVITSATGAAIKDVLSVLQRRNPAIEVVIYPTMVQGDTASQQIIDALEKAQQRNEVDLLLLTRGGGSMEDLWCFNNEQLARKIAQITLPIVSAVGHEIDFTISDFVADMRAATPSAAAELISYSNAEAGTQLSHLKQRLNRALTHLMAAKKGQLLATEGLLKTLHPQHQIQQQWQRLDQLQLRLNTTINKERTAASQQLEQLQTRLMTLSPASKFAVLRSDLAQLGQRLNYAMENNLRSKQQAFVATCQLLDTVSPLATLSRGYSITFTNNNVLKSRHDVSVGDTLTTRLVDGEIKSQVL